MGGRQGGKDWSNTILIPIFGLKFLVSLFPSGVWFRTLRSFQIFLLVGRGWLHKDPWLLCFWALSVFCLGHSYAACSGSSWESCFHCLCPVPCLEVGGCRESKCARKVGLGQRYLDQPVVSVRKLWKDTCCVFSCRLSVGKALSQAALTCCPWFFFLSGSGNPNYVVALATPCVPAQGCCATSGCLGLLGAWGRSLSVSSL